MQPGDGPRPGRGHGHGGPAPHPGWDQQGYGGPAPHPGWDQQNPGPSYGPPEPGRGAPDPGRRRASAPVLVGVSLWRLVLAATALVGFFAALTGDFEREIRWFNLNYFSQLGALAVGLTALGGLLSPLWSGGAMEGRRGFVRGATTTYSLLIMIVFATLLEGDYTSLSSKLEHLAVPILALVDWVFVGRNSRTLQWWWPLVWLVGPLVYLPFYIGASHDRGRPLYGFLDPDESSFWGVAVGVLAGFLLLGYVLWAIGRLKNLVQRA